jgi:hypothetical protein
MKKVILAIVSVVALVIAIGFIGISRESPEMAYSRIQNSIRENDPNKSLKVAP